jgi:hypothetical protein
MSKQYDEFCIFGSSMKEGIAKDPFDTISDYVIILPIIAGLIVLGRVLGSDKQFKLVYLIIALILVGDLSEVINNSYYLCIPLADKTEKQWDWQALVDTGIDLENFVIFIWLYMWEATRHAKEKEAKLQEMAKQEDSSLTFELQMRKFRIDVGNFVIEHEKQRKKFLCKFYFAVGFEIFIDIVYLIVLIILGTDNVAKYLTREGFLFFQAINLIFVTCLMIITFNGLRKILKANPQIAISKWQVGFNLVTVCAMLIDFFIDSGNWIQIISVLFQMNVLWFCWNLVKRPKNTGSQETAANRISTQITQQLEQVANNLTKAQA